MPVTQFCIEMVTKNTVLKKLGRKVSKFYMKNDEICKISYSPNWNNWLGGGFFQGRCAMYIRNKIKCFLFGILVSGLFGSVFAVETSSGYNFYPLHFDYVIRTDSAAQKAEWDNLMKYKVFGTNGVDFLGTNINIPDKVGWFGSSKGGWTMKNEKHRVGGPIVIGGNVSFDDGQDSILTGPTRITGSISVGNFNPTNYVSGTVCIENGPIDSKFVNLVSNDNRYFSGGNGYENCPSIGPDSVPHVNKNLSIPLIDDADLPPYRDDQSLVFLKEGNHTVVPNGMIYVDGTTGYIDIPKSTKATEEEREADVYDLHVSEMHLKNENHLIVRMPEGGRLTRIFIDGAFEVNAHSHIQVMYMDTSATYDESTHRWSGSSSAIQNDKYMGNLLFYAKKDMEWDALTPTDSIQGTFIAYGKIHVKQQMTLAGQLLANKIEIDANFDGSGFIFKPFNPSHIDPDALAQGQYEENDALVAIDIRLDKVSTTDVRFDYYFKHYSTDKDDFKMEYDWEFPIDTLAAGKKEADRTEPVRKDSVRIFAGELTPTDSVYKAWIRVSKDRKVEGDEYFYICISNLSGAVIKGNYDAEGDGSVCLPLMVLDGDNYPPVFQEDTTLKVTENIKGDIAGTIVTTDKDNDPATYSIVGGTGKDIFVIDENSGVLSLKTDVSVDYETNQSFTVQIAATDGHVTEPVKKTYTVNVVDVNENPIAEDTSFVIKENSPAGTVVGYFSWDDLDAASKFTKHNVARAVDGDMDLFDVDADGTITVKEGAVLDYESQKEHYLKIRVEDSTDVSLYDEASVTIKLTDENDGPTIIIVPGDDPKNDPKNHILVLKNGDKNGTEENNEKDALAGTVKATCTALNCMDNLTFTMLEDTSGLFAMDAKTGNITVKDAMVLDFEKINEYAVKVFVCDNNPKGEKFNQYDTAKVIIRVIDVNELPSLKDGSLVVDEHQPVGTVVGKMDTLTSDLDTAYVFTQHKFRGIDGDTSVFKVSEKGVVTTRESLDYVKDSTYSIVVEVLDKVDTTLRDTATMSVKVKNVNDNPYFTSPDEYEFPENPNKGYVIGKLTAEDKDLDDSVFTFKLKSKVDYVTISEDGVMKVKDSTAFDYEKANKLSFEVTVIDQNGGSSDTLITVSLIDVNEPVKLPPQTFTVREDSDTGVVIGKIVAKDLDTAKAFTQHTFELIGRSVGFKVEKDGSIILLDSLDYETDSIYVLKVSVTDGEFCDTNDITIKVKDVMERSEVIITRGETPDSVWLMPDTIYTNRPTIDLEWTEDGVKRYGTETLKDGKNVIIKKYDNPTKNIGGADTVVVFVNSDNPEVVVSTKAKKVTADNIYTVVQAKEKGDSAYYINDNDNDIFVSVKDPVSSKVDTFTVGLELDSIYLTPSTFSKTMKKIAEAKLTLDRNATSEKTTTQLNGDVYATTYKEIVDGKDVLVTYYTDFKGNLVKGESGKKEIKVSYTATIDGRDVVVSYMADASTGEMIEGRNGSTYMVSYDYVDSTENSVNVAYGVDEDGAFVMDEEGNAGYEVSYSYTNKYGNTATKSVYIVVDKVAPKVEILYPSDGEVFHSNFVDVKWTVDGVVQDTLVTQGLQKGTFPIVRYYRDKAGNTDSAVVIVVVKNSKDVEIAVEKPVTVIDEDRVAKYYGSNPPQKKESFAISVFNVSEGAEEEVLIGGDMKTKKGSRKEPYPGLKGHLGPTLTIDAKLPTVNEVRGLATLDDLVNKDGLIAVDGVDADKSEKLTPEKYAEKYCSAEFAKSLPSDFSKANLFVTTIGVDVWIYTNLGQFVDKISYSMDLDNPDYVNDAGRLSMYMEMKPDLDGNVRTKEGRLLATGAYVYKTEVNMHSTLRCDLPPVSDMSNKSSKIGAKRKVSEELLKPFGYKRPDGK